LEWVYPFRIIVFDIKVFNPESFENEIFLTVEKIMVRVKLLRLLRTCLTPGPIRTDVTKVHIHNVDLLYEMGSADLNLTNSNIYTVLQSIRANISKHSTPKSILPKKNKRRRRCVFSLREVQTFGVTAALAVDGVDLPIEHRRIPIRDIYYADFLGHIRSTFKQVTWWKTAEADLAEQWKTTEADLAEQYADLTEIIHTFIEEMSGRVAEQMKVTYCEAGLDALGSEFHEIAQRAEASWKEMDADDDGNVSPSEVAAALWSKLKF